MEFKIFFIGQYYWIRKWQGVILVEKEEDIEPLYEMLHEQDAEWLNFKCLIRVAPKEIEHESDLRAICQNVGRTRIHDIELLRKKIPFILYQYKECKECSLSLNPPT